MVVFEKFCSEIKIFGYKLIKCRSQFHILTLFPLGGGHGVSLHIQFITFQIWIELHSWKLYDNIISSVLHI